MRRKERAITNDLLAIIDKCDVCRVAFCDGEKPYIVPMNFGYVFNEEKLFLYFHCANEGRKLDIIRSNNNVCYEMDCMHKLVPGLKPCNWSSEYESIIGQGKISIVEDPAERIIGLTAIMRKYTGVDKHEFDVNTMMKTIILKITTGSICGKRSV